MNKKLLLIVIATLLCTFLGMTALAAEDTVYLDGTGATEGAYTDLKSAVSALQSGGKIVVSGDTTVGTSSAGVTLSAVGGKVTVTSENDAVLTLARSLTLASEIEFNNITICNTHASVGRIIANGNKITIGEGVTTTTTVDRYPSIIGGKASGTCTGSHVVIKSGTWFIVFGGSYGGTFTGDSTVDFTGGTVKAVLTGGNRAGNFTGNATINIGGNAVVEYNKDDENADYMGVIGGSMGLKSSTTAYTFKGNITVNISGNAKIAANVLGASRYSHITTEGDITVTVSENAALTRNIYAGGYYGGVTTGDGGIRVILKDNVTVGTDRYVCAGSLNAGTINGNGSVEFYGNATLTGAVYTAGLATTFNGNTTAALYGGKVTSTFSATSKDGTASGTETVLLKNGTVGGAVKGNATIDLAADASVTIGSCTGTITTAVPDGYELVTDGLTYSVREISTEVAPTLVYVDGTLAESGDGLTKETAVNTLSEAAILLRDGGTIVVSGNTSVDTSTTLAAGGELLVTSVYEDEDYTDTAAILVSNNIVLGAPTTFKDIVLEKAATGDDYIVAAGNALVIDEGVFCRNNFATRYISIVGGAMSGTFEGESSITVKSGYFRNIFGGNYNGTFKGDSNVTFTGGYVDNMITGGSFMGNFEGDSHVNIGGDAVLVYQSTSSGVNGACCGSGTAAYTFVGDIYINLYGSARINNSVYGTTRYDNVTTTGNVYITVKDDAFVYQNLYAGGYNGILNGSTSVVMDGGWVGVNLAAGSRTGTVNGDTYLEVNGGQINYYATNIHSSMSDVPGEYNVAGGGLTGTVNGNTEVVINGGDIYGNVYGGGISTGTVSGNSTVTLKGGSIMCGVYADGATVGSVSGTKTLDIDLTDGGNLSIGLSADVNSLIGGGSLTLFPEAVVTAEKFSGNVALSINGVPQGRTYITAAETDNASVAYTAQGSETFTEEEGKFGISSDGYFATTKVTFIHTSDVQIYMRNGLVTDGDKLAATSAEDGKTVYDLEEGLYNYVIYHTQDDYKRKYIYITGKEETLTYDFSTYTAKVGEGFEAAHFLENTEEIYEKFYSTDDLKGYTVPDSPYFNNNRYGTRLFTSNTEMYEFIAEKVASCDYAYAYDLFTSPSGNTVPAVIFTKDDIPAGATLEDVAKTVTANGGRDIMMVTAIVHGNEPSAGEGALALISDLCGEYGDELLTGNVGAVIIIPRLNPDGCESFTRNTPTAVGEGNLNRDYAILTSVEISGVVKAYDLFAPTILIDCHEAPLDPQWGESYTLSDVYDVGLMMAGTLNTPFVDATAAIKGDYENKGTRCAELLTAAMEGIEETGIRAYYYQTPMTFPANNSPYGLTNGSYTFLIEVPGISGGDAVFARRVFAQVTAMKEIFALAKESDGALAKEVNDAREKTSLSAQVFDVDTPIVLKHGYTRHDSATLLWNNPLVAADATVRKAENITKYYMQDVAILYRSRPTAYVVSADADGVDKVLEVLGKQGIAYYLLDADTTLNLRQYGGTSSTATLGAAAEVTFDAGAYIVPVDGYKAYLISTLFEPENPDSGDYVTTFAQAGYIAVSDIYRSEESYIAAKLGLDGTYTEVSVHEGKTVDTATVDGKGYADVGTDGANAYVVTSDSEYYTITLNFTDGTSETYYIGTLKGDVNGDNKVTVADALILVKAIVNGEPVDCDMNADGKLTLIDVLRIMKIAVK